MRVIRVASREEFERACVESDWRQDGFARTFRAKADMLSLWENLTCAFDGAELESAIIIRCSKRSPVVANLQLLHTFSRHRRKGAATALTVEAFDRVQSEHGPSYFRVSAEPDAAPFYRSLGLRFWGHQKSGSLLCIGKVPHPLCGLQDLVYDRDDHVIAAALGDGTAKRKGQVCLFFPDPR